MLSLIVASKFLDDFYCRSAYFSAVGNVPVKTLNDLELNLCFLLDFNLSVSKEEFDATLSILTVGETRVCLFLTLQNLAFMPPRPLG